MKLRGWGIALAGLVACGGSTAGSVGDAGGSDAGAVDAYVVPDTSISDDSSRPAETGTPDVGSTALLYDGTTGQACTTDTDCTVPNGPGVARCSSTVFAPQAYYPTAVCVLPSCSPVSDTTIHYCDGPDVPTSPGICVPQSTGGLCLPKCTFDKTGDPATGCQGKDICRVYTSATETGAGYCWGGCLQDSDCPTGQQCQVDQGLCMEGLVPPTKTYGTACSQADTDDGACNCLFGGASQTGYCSDFCVVGGAATCPTGSVCDGLEYRQDGFTMNNPGLGGYCAVGCSTTDAGITCPPSSTCTDIFAAGPDCVP
ncbi:MAG TPA: hypothetical protein VGL81_14100 [Polyangiaceae bacterium]